jgi:hypothetical protein
LAVITIRLSRKRSFKLFWLQNDGIQPGTPHAGLPYIRARPAHCAAAKPLTAARQTYHSSKITSTTTAATTTVTNATASLVDIRHIECELPVRGK